MSGQTKIRAATTRNTLLAGVAAVALSAAAPNAAQAQDGSFFGFVEGRYLMSFGDETDVGVGQQGCDVYSLDCSFTYDATETDDGVGGKVKLGFRSSGAWDVAIAGSGGMLDGDREAAEANLDYMGYDLNAEGDLESETQYAVADFEVGYNIGIGNNGGNVRLFIGARYARFDQNVNFSGIAEGSNGSNTFNTLFLADREVEFEGVGPRIGLGLNLPLGNRVSIAAEVSGSALFGDRDTDDTLFSDITAGGRGPGPFSDSDSEDDVIANAEGNIGLSFVVAGSHPGPVAEITFGYHVEAWFGVNNTEWDMIGSVPGAQGNADDGFGVAEEDGDQYIHGPFVRIGIRR